MSKFLRAQARKWSHVEPTEFATKIFGNKLDNRHNHLGISKVVRIFYGLQLLQHKKEKIDTEATHISIAPSTQQNGFLLPIVTQRRHATFLVLTIPKS